MRNRFDLVEVLCQQCNKNKVLVEKNQPYFGILCGECRKPTVYRASSPWIKEKKIGDGNGSKSKSNNREEV